MWVEVVRYGSVTATGVRGVAVVDGGHRAPPSVASDVWPVPVHAGTVVGAVELGEQLLAPLDLMWLDPTVQAEGSATTR